MVGIFIVLHLKAIKFSLANLSYCFYEIYYLFKVICVVGYKQFWINNVRNRLSPCLVIFYYLIFIYNQLKKILGQKCDWRISGKPNHLFEVSLVTSYKSSCKPELKHACRNDRKNVIVRCYYLVSGSNEFTKNAFFIST